MWDDLTDELLRDEPEAVNAFLREAGFKAMHAATLGRLFLLCENRTNLLQLLQERGVAELTARQKIANELQKLRRTNPMPAVVPHANLPHTSMTQSPSHHPRQLM